MPLEDDPLSSALADVPPKNKLERFRSEPLFDDDDDETEEAKEESRASRWYRLLGIEKDDEMEERYRSMLASAPDDGRRRKETVDTVRELLLEKGCALAAGEPSVGGALGVVSSSGPCRNIVANVIAAWTCYGADEYRKDESLDVGFFLRDAVLHAAAVCVCAFLAPRGCEAWNAAVASEDGDNSTIVEAGAYRLLCAFAQSNRRFAFLQSECEEASKRAEGLAANVDPELAATLTKIDNLADTQRLWLASLWACEPDLEDAFSMWESVFRLIDEEGEATSFCEAALCASLVRRRDTLLASDVDHSTVWASATRKETVDEAATLAREAEFIEDPRSRTAADVEVVSFGPGPLGILLTRKRRGLVVSNFSSEDRRMTGSPQIADTLIAVNGRALPKDATLNDAVALLGGIGRPVLVAFKRARPEDLASDANDEAQAAARRERLNGSIARNAQQQQQQQLVPSSSSSSLTFHSSSSSGNLHQSSESLATVNNGFAPQPSPAVIVEPILTPLDEAPIAPDGYTVELLAGEVVFASASCVAPDVVLSDPRRCGSLASCTFSGELYCTSYRVVFHVVGSSGQPSWATARSPDWQLPLRCLERCELTQPTASSRSLHLAAKDGQRRRFSIPGNFADDSIKLARAINTLAFSGAPDAFARAHRRALDLLASQDFFDQSGPAAAKNDDGGEGEGEPVLDDLSSEADLEKRRRQGRPISLPLMASYTLENEYMRSTLRDYITRDYPSRGLRLVRQQSVPLCETYPPELVVPSSVSDLELKRVAAYRSRARFPVVIWTSPDPESGATISRSSQPKPGVQNKRSSDDERYLDELRLLCSAKRLVIIDARSKVATQGNRVMGMGTELTRYYEGVDLQYGNIANIHAARDALQGVHALCRCSVSSSATSSSTSFFDSAVSVVGNGHQTGSGSSSSSNPFAYASTLASGASSSSSSSSSSEGSTWLAKLDATSWLKQVHSILASAVRTVELVHYKKTSVLVHCKYSRFIMIMLFAGSDGWDRTPQITVLAVMMLDARYRTIDGFLSLCQKEWVDFGHKFDERCAHQEGTPADQRSPVFLLFVDCLANMTRQFPKR